MGACSSKPKTTEFEGSTEPSKKTEDAGADRSIDAAQVSQQNEPGKEDGRAADTGAEAVQVTRELIASKDEEPLIKELLSTAEGVSCSVKTESSAVDEEAGDSAAEKVKADVGDALKVDVGDGAADKATTVDDGVGGDQDKLFEDKAVVLDEASNDVVGKGDAYIDKAVAAADDEKAHESSDKGSGSVTAHDEELGGADDARGEEAPLASADAQDESSVEDIAKPETLEDPQNNIDESTSEPQEESPLEESAHAEVMENEGNAGVLDEPEPEAPKVQEGIDAETSIEPKPETTIEQAIEGQCEGIVDEPNASDVQPQALAIEETAEDGKPDHATPDEAIAEPSAETDREENVIEEATTNESKVESVDAGNLESPVEHAIKAPGEGDLAFEDASDVPLKVQSSTIESGDKPNS